MLGDCSFIGTGPGRWLVVVEKSDGETLERGLARTAGISGSVCDQSDGFVVFELAGARLRDALAKLLAIDIDPRVFGVGSAATTSAALIGVTFWLLDEAPRYRVAESKLGLHIIPETLRDAGGNMASHNLSFTLENPGALPPLGPAKLTEDRLLESCAFAAYASEVVYARTLSYRMIRIV